MLVGPLTFKSLLLNSVRETEYHSLSAHHSTLRYIGRCGCIVWGARNLCLLPQRTDTTHKAWILNTFASSNMHTHTMCISIFFSGCQSLSLSLSHIYVYIYIYIYIYVCVCVCVCVYLCILSVYTCFEFTYAS